MESMRLEIVAPDEVIAKEEGVQEIILPGTLGEIDILPQHTEFMTTLTEGTVRFRRQGSEKTYNITGGFFSIKNNEATMLVDGLMATVTSIDEARKQRASA